MDDSNSSHVSHRAVPCHVEVLSFNDQACQDPGLVGSKAATLARLYHFARGTVPFGVVLPAQQSAALANINESSDHAKASQAVLAALEGHGLSMDRHCAVRSSALDEDSAGHSYAGQYESVLGVASAQDIVNAIRTCVLSAASARVAAYRGASPQQGVPVLIQRMIPADRAGVVFTANPLTGANEFVINASFGLGDMLVSGEVTPDEIIVDSSGLVSKMTVGTKRTMSILTYGGIIRTPVPESLRPNHGHECLSEPFRRARCSTCGYLSHLFIFGAAGSRFSTCKRNWLPRGASCASESPTLD